MNKIIERGAEENQVSQSAELPHQDSSRSSLTASVRSDERQLAQVAPIPHDLLPTKLATTPQTPKVGEEEEALGAFP